MRRIVVYLIVVAIVFTACFMGVSGSVGLNDWVSYLVLGIVMGLMAILIIANEIWIYVSRRKKK